MTSVQQSSSLLLAGAVAGCAVTYAVMSRRTKTKSCAMEPRPPSSHYPATCDLSTFDPAALNFNETRLEGQAMYGLPHTVDEAMVHIIPVPWEATASYRLGTAAAPSAALAHSEQVDLHDIESGDAWRCGIAMRGADPRLAEWNEAAVALSKPICEEGGPGEDAGMLAACTQVDGLCEKMIDSVRTETLAVLRAGKIPGIFGGDHSVAYPAITAMCDCLDSSGGDSGAPGAAALGVLHIDAHCDLRENFEGFKYSHAGVFRHVLQDRRIGKLVSVGLRDVCAAELQLLEQDSKAQAFFDADIAHRLAEGENWGTICREIVAALPQTVWVSWDIDGFDPVVCPATGTPVPGGLTWQQGMVLLRTLAHSGRKIVGFDLCEVNGLEEWDGIVAARLLYKLASWAIFTNVAPARASTSFFRF